jgi:hypothetical protein
MFEYLDRTANDSIANQIKTGVRDVEGGAKSVEITSLEVDGDTARATARASIWLRTVGVDPRAETIGDDGDWWIFKLHLTRTDGGWRIDDLESLPEGGTSP